MAISVEVSRDMPGLGGLNMWVWASIMPGSTVAWLRSITWAPAGIFTCDSGPTSVMRSPCSTMICPRSICPLLLSNSCPARTATVPPAARI